jgi:uncharacterized protein (TIGR02246 family)
MLGIDLHDTSLDIIPEPMGGIMRRFGSCMAVLIPLLVAGPVSAGDKDKAQQAIRAGVDEWLAAFKAGDIDRLMTMYMPDAIVALHGQPALKGKDAVRAYFAPGMGKSDIDFRIEIDSIRVHGKTADLLSRYWFTARPRDGGPVYRDAGRSVVLYKRDADGRWKIRLDMDQDTPDVTFEDAQ